MWNPTVWGMVNKPWLRIRRMQKHIWNVTSVMYNVVSTIRLLFSGHWVMKPVSDRTLKHVTLGSRMKIRAVPFSMSRQERMNLPISIVRCIWDIKDAKTIVIVMSTNRLSSASMRMQWVIHRVDSKNTGILSVNIRNIRVVSSGTLWISHCV